MNPLAQQVAGLLHAYHPPMPPSGRIHRCLDDDEIPAKEEGTKQCSKCHKWKSADEYWLRADGKRYGYCRICASKQDRERRQKNHDSRPRPRA